MIEKLSGKRELEFFVVVHSRRRRRCLRSQLSVFTDFGRDKLIPKEKKYNENTLLTKGIDHARFTCVRFDRNDTLKYVQRNNTQTR